MNNKKIVSMVLAASLLAQPLVGTRAYAAESQKDKYGYAVAFEYDQKLPVDKQIELDNLVKEFNMSPEDTQEVKGLYFQNKMVAERGKVGAVLKVVKAAKPVLVKAAKVFGMKMAEKSLADFTDYLFEWQGKLQDGIENFLVNKWGWSRTAARWSAKTIMFVAF